MGDERAIIARAESADPEELAGVLAAPSEEEESALRSYLGTEEFEELQGLAREQAGDAEAAAESKGNVVVIPGIMGSTLSGGGRGDHERIWLDPLYLAFRRLDVLRLREDGRTGYKRGYDVVATGMIPFVYWRQILSLKRTWNVYPFWFDWRKDLADSADELSRYIDTRIGQDAPVHIVGHSMGGLVARTFIQRYAPRWESMWDRESDGKAGGRLVMLGTPNHGSFAIPLLLTGLGSMVRRLAAASLPHGLSDLLEITNSFVGTYQMLPSPRALPTMKPLYSSETYAASSRSVRVPQGRLDGALDHYDRLEHVVDSERMIYVAGYGRPTINGISDFTQLASLDAYETTATEGDGTVPHELGILQTADGEPVRTYFVDASHTGLPRDDLVVAALDELLETGTTRTLQDRVPRAEAERLEATGDTLATLAATRDAEVERASVLAERIRARNAGSGDIQGSMDPEERELAEILVRGF